MRRVLLSPRARTAPGRFGLSPIVVFDLDGTLADTAPDLIGTLNVILAGEGLPAVPLAEARDRVGAGARALIERGLALAGRTVGPAHLDELYRAFLAHYAANVCVATRLYPGALQALDRLDESSFLLGVCTNKVERHATGLLQALGIAHRFAVVAGRDSYPHFKPDPRHLTLAIEEARGDARRAVMVGDSRTDVVTARAAGIPVVAVSFGYAEVPVRDLGADRVIDHFDALFEAVEDLAATPAGAQAAMV